MRNQSMVLKKMLQESRVHSPNNCDEWADNVKGKIEFYSNDLPAADCVSHRSCCINLRILKQIPHKYIGIFIRDKSGWPENQVE